MKLNNCLLPHQEAAVKKLIKLKVGALFMEQGTGKTITALELIRMRYEANKISAVIWLCPCSAKQNIKSEIIKQCPNELLSIFTICGIETLSTSVRALTYLIKIVENRDCFIVVDESLMVKNHKAYRTENILKIAEKCKYKLILNGTPISKNEADLYSQFYLLDWRILGYKSFWSFAANHLEYDGDRVRKVLNSDYLAQKISPYTFQALKEECITLPEKNYNTYYFDLTQSQSDEYDNVANVLLMEVDEMKPETIYRLFSGLQAVVSGKQLVFSGGKKSHFETVEFFNNPLDNPRIKRLMDLIEEKIKKEKAIIFCRYESEITQLCDLIKDSVRFDGKVRQKNRGEVLKNFQGKKQFLIANRNCAGFSLNLQFCRNIIYFSSDWDLGKRLQSEDRIHRIGQEREVYIYDICANNTIDERILECLIRKERILDSIKSELGKNENNIDFLKKIIRGRKIYDCSDLEDKNEDI